MVTIKKHLDKIGSMGDKIIGYSIINSMITIMLEAADELEDDEISIHLEDLQTIVIRKHKEIMNTTISQVKNA